MDKNHRVGLLGSLVKFNSVSVMITQLAWTTWTPMSAVPKRLLNLLNHSLTHLVNLRKHSMILHVSWSNEVQSFSQLWCQTIGVFYICNSFLLCTWNSHIVSICENDISHIWITVQFTDVYNKNNPVGSITMQSYARCCTHNRSRTWVRFEITEYIIPLCINYVNTMREIYIKCHCTYTIWLQCQKAAVQALVEHTKRANSKHMQSVITTRWVRQNTCLVA